MIDLRRYYVIMEVFESGRRRWTRLVTDGHVRSLGGAHGHVAAKPPTSNEDRTSAVSRDFPGVADRGRGMCLGLSAHIE